MNNRIYTTIVCVLLAMVFVGSTAIITKSNSVKVMKSLENVKTGITAITLEKEKTYDIRKCISDMGEKEFKDYIMRKYKLSKDEAKELYASGNDYYVYNICLEVYNDSGTDLNGVKIEEKIIDNVWLSTDGIQSKSESSIKKGTTYKCTFGLLAKQISKDTVLQDFVYEKLCNRNFIIAFDCKPNIIEKESGTVYISNSYTDVAYIN